MTGYDSEYKCNCDASAGAPDHARTCPEHRDFGKISGKDIVDAYESRGASVTPNKSAPNLHGIATEILGKLDHPTACVTSLDTDRLRAALKAADDTEAELYALQDQVTGLQDLMADQRMPAHLDHAVRYLVTQADAEASTMHFPVGGSPRHGHIVPGRWDGDATHAKGSLCEECAAWDALRLYASKDIVAEAQVIEDARVTQLLAILTKFVEHHDIHQLELTEDQKVDQDLLWFEAVAEARAATIRQEIYALPRFHAGEVDLIVELQAMRQGDGHPKEALDKLGIIWKQYSGQPLADQVHLHGCTNVPVVLPDWLRLKAETVKPFTEPRLPEYHAGKVDLVVNVINMPRSRGNLTADIRALGIGYAAKSMDDFGGTITLHGCTNVPVDLPSWLEVKK